MKTVKRKTAAKKNPVRKVAAKASRKVVRKKAIKPPAPSREKMVFEYIDRRTAIVEAMPQDHAAVVAKMAELGFITAGPFETYEALHNGPDMSAPVVGEFKAFAAGPAPARMDDKPFIVYPAQPFLPNSITASLVGKNIVTLTNPSAITFPRVNADNTADLLSASAFRTAIGAGTSSFSGAFSSLTGTPTTLSGYGITDAQGLDSDLTSWAAITRGTGFDTAAASNVGSAGAFVVNGGALGTPSGGTLTNCTFPTLNQNTTGSAAKWTTARTIGGASIDGSAVVSYDSLLGVTSAANRVYGFSGSVTPSLYVTASANTASALVQRDGSGNFTAGTITAALTGNASTATAWANARTIGGASVDGSGNISYNSLLGVTTAADKGYYFTGAGTPGVFDLSSFARTVLDDTTNTAARTTLQAAPYGTTVVYHTIGAPTPFEASADTDVARGTAAKSAADSMTTAGDHLVLGGGIYDLGSGALIPAADNCTISGAGPNTTFLKSTRDQGTGPIVQVRTGCTVENFNFIRTRVDDTFQTIVGNSLAGGNCTNVRIRNVDTTGGGSDIFVLVAGDSDVQSYTIENCHWTSMWDALASTIAAGDTNQATIANVTVDLINSDFTTTSDVLFGGDGCCRCGMGTWRFRNCRITAPGVSDVPLTVTDNAEGNNPAAVFLKATTFKTAGGTDISISAGGACTDEGGNTYGTVSGTITRGNVFGNQNLPTLGALAIVDADIVYGSAAKTFSRLAKDTNATRYLSNTGTGNRPAWAQVNVANGVTGTLPVGNGGLGIATGTSGGVLAFTGSTTIASSGALTANALMIGGGAGAAPSTTTTGTGVLTALGNAVDASGGALTTASLPTQATKHAQDFLRTGGTVGSDWVFYDTDKYYGANGAQNDEYKTTVVLVPGQYDLLWSVKTGTNTGVFTVKLDGSTLDTFDTYNPSPGAANFTISNKTFSAGIHTLSYVMATKNAASSGTGYYPILNAVHIEKHGGY